MFAGMKQLLSPSNKDLRKRIYFTLMCLGLFCLGTTITIPWASAVYQELGFLEIFNLMSGGGLRSFSIFALGVSPYITASIITQLLQMDIIPYFKELKEEGYTGRQKINRITRYLGIIFAFLQGYILTIVYMKGMGTAEILKTSLVMTAGTCFLLWIGDQVTSKGIGNGMSLLIMAGIIQSMPSMFVTTFQSLVLSGTYTTLIGSLLVNLIGNTNAINFVNNYIEYTSLTGFILYILLIFFFGYFYTFIEMNPEEMAKNLNKNGGYIPGIRPGKDTVKYVSNIIKRLTVVGTLFLVIIAGLPIVFSKFSGLPSSVTIGGTGLLIVVGVAIETYKQIESSLVSRSYKRGRRRR